MSFKIFSLQLLGKIKPVETIETQRKQLFDDFVEFQRVEKSEELKNYLELDKKVNSTEFKNKKSEIEGLRFKGSREYNLLKEYHSLEKKQRIRNFLKIDGSTELPKFGKLKNSEKLAEFFTLKKYVSDGSFKNDKKTALHNKVKFETTEAFKKHSRFKQLESDADIRFVLDFEKSKLYKNYLAVKDSSDLKRFRELSETTKSAEFTARVKYLEDPKKWEKTDEYKQQQQWLEMKKMPHLVKYFKNKGTTVFDFYRNWEVAFADDFSAAKIDTEKWSFLSVAANKMLGDNYALAGDLSLFTDGKNIKTGKKLVIETRKEKAKGKIWKMSAGFVPTELEYTSGMISSWNSFEMEDGIFEAKIKFNPVHAVVSSFYLSGLQDLPRVNLLEMGAKNRLGVLTLDKSKAHVEGLDISNLNSGKWYIFTIEKLGSNITWKINGTEIFTQQYPGVKGKLHLNASTLVVNEISASQLPAVFEIEWVKCWRKKQ